jgi:hypothetical protein
LSDQRTSVCSRSDPPANDNSRIKHRVCIGNRQEMNNETSQLSPHRKDKASLGRFNKPFIIATFKYNTRTMTSPHKVYKLRNYVISQGIDVIFHQETKILHSKEEANLQTSHLTDGTKFIHGSATREVNARGTSGDIAALILSANAPNIVDTQLIILRILT